MPPKKILSEKPEVAVRSVLNRRFDKKKKQYEYMVLWEDEDETWEPGSNLMHVNKKGKVVYNKHLLDYERESGITHSTESSDKSESLESEKEDLAVENSELPRIRPTYFSPQPSQGTASAQKKRFKKTNFLCSTCHTFRLTTKRRNFVPCIQCHHLQLAHGYEVNVGVKKSRWKSEHVCPVVDGVAFECDSSKNCPTNPKKCHGDELVEAKNSQHFGESASHSLSLLSADERLNLLQKEYATLQKRKEEADLKRNSPTIRIK